MTGALWSGPTPEADADAAFWGIPAEALQTAREDGEVWPEHVAAVQAFLAVRNRWQLIQRAGPMGHLTTVAHGLDLTQAEVAWRLAGITISPELWTQIEAIEDGALEALNSP
jgi:hypothetical protein